MQDLSLSEKRLINYILSKAITLHQEGEKNKLFGAAIDHYGQLHPIGIMPDNLNSPHLLFLERIEFHLQQYLEKSKYTIGAIGEDVEIFTKDVSGNLIPLEGFMIKVFYEKDILNKRFIYKENNLSLVLEEFI